MTNEASEREAFRCSICGAPAAVPAVQAPVAWLHEVQEPDHQQPFTLLSRDAANPWAHWCAGHKARCTFKVTPLYAAAPTAAQPNTDGVEMVAPAGGLDPGPPRCSDPGPPPPIYGVSACELCVKGFPVENGQHYGTQALGMIQATPCTAGVTTCGGPEGGCLAICDQHAACKLRAAGAPASSAPFDKVRAHCLIYDLFINDDQLIRSMAAQDLKRLLGITGPVPANHSGVAPVEAPRCPHGIRHPHPCRECEDAPLPAGVQPSDGGQEK
jgi:hypothetical protein